MCIGLQRFHIESFGHQGFGRAAMKQDILKKCFYKIRFFKNPSVYLSQMFLEMSTISNSIPKICFLYSNKFPFYILTISLKLLAF